LTVKHRAVRHPVSPLVDAPARELLAIDYSIICR